MQTYRLTDLLLKKQRFLDTSVEHLWNRTQTEDITLLPEGLTRIICGITWGRGKHGVNRVIVKLRYSDNQTILSNGV